MNEEALEILRMVKEGTVSPEQGVELLEAAKTSTSSLSPTGQGKPRFVRVRVDISKPDGGKEVAVNLNLPIALADIGLKVLQGAKITEDGRTIILGEYLKDLGGLDISTILQMVKEGAAGKLVDITADEVKIEVIVD